MPPLNDMPRATGYNASMTPETDSPREQWLGILMLLVCAVLWSLNGPLIKLLDRQDVPGITIACYRSLLGAAVFVPIAARRAKTLRNVSPVWPIGGIITFTVMTASFVIANTQTAAANAIILQYTSPLWVFLLAPLLLGERARREEGLALTLSMVGVAIIFFGNVDPTPTGLIIGLVSGLGYGTLTVVLRGLRRVDPTVVAGTNALGSGLLLAPFVVLYGRFALSTPEWGLMLLLALVQFTLPYVLFSWALQRVAAHRAALILLLEPILNPIWTYIAIREIPPPATLLGGPLILLSVVAWLWLNWRRQRSTALPPTA